MKNTFFTLSALCFTSLPVWGASAALAKAAKSEPVASASCPIVVNTKTKILYKQGHAEYQKLIKESNTAGTKAECFMSEAEAEKAGFHAQGKTAKATTVKP